MPRPCRNFVTDWCANCGNCGHPWWEHRRQDFKPFNPERVWMADYYLSELGPCPRCLLDIAVPTPPASDLCRAKYEPKMMDPSGWYPPFGLHCDRAAGHSGRHHHRNEERVVAVWSDHQLKGLDWTRYAGTRC